MIEDAKVKIRSIRRDANDELKAKVKNKDYLKIKSLTLQIKIKL